MLRTMKIFWLVVVLSFGVSFVHSQDEVITNQDIIALTSVRLSKSLIIQKIGLTKAKFDLSTKGLIALKRAGVADEVVSAMFAAHKSASTPAVGQAQGPPRPTWVAAATSQPPPEPAPVITTRSEALASGTIVAPASEAPPEPAPVRTAGSETLPADRTASEAPAAQDTVPSDDATDPACLQARLDPANTDTYTKNLCSLVKNVVSQPVPRIYVTNVNSQISTLFAAQIAKNNELFENDSEKSAAAKELFLEGDKKRTDKQIGGGPGNSGTTSLAVKGGGPSIIGWAVEHGGATSSINGNTVTVRVNPFGLMRVLQGEGFLGTDFLRNLTNRGRGASVSPDVRFSDALRKFSTSFSFDMTRGQATPTFIVSKQQLSAFSLRYEFINQRNPQSKHAQSLFREYVASSKPDLAGLAGVATQLFDLRTRKYRNAALQTWLDETNAAIAEVPNPVKQKLEDIQERYKSRLKQLQEQLEEKINQLPMGPTKGQLEKELREKFETDKVKLQTEIKAILQAFFDFVDSRVQEIFGLIARNRVVNDIAAIANPVANSRYEEGVRLAVAKRLDLLPVEAMVGDPLVKASFEQFANISLNFDKRRSNFIEELNKGTVATLEYSNFREPIAPDTSNFRFIWENGRFFKNTDFTLNASLTMYNKKPTFAGVNRVRDFQFALQTDTSLGNTFGTGNTILTFAGKYERLNGDTIDPLGIVKPNTKGDTAVGQFKLTIPIADWGIKLPLSITFANRSDLIKESTVRANFGFTFDLDPIFARFKPF